MKDMLTGSSDIQILDGLKVSKKIYNTAQEGVLTIFLQWHWIVKGRGVLRLRGCTLCLDMFPAWGVSPFPWEDLLIRIQE